MGVAKPYLIPGKRIKPSEYIQSFSKENKGWSIADRNHILLFEDNINHWGHTTDFLVEQEIREREQIDVTSLDSGGFREFITGPLTMKIVANNVEWYFGDIPPEDFFASGNTLPFKILENGVTISGTGLVTEINLTGNGLDNMKRNIVLTVMEQITIES